MVGPGRASIFKIVLPVLGRIQQLQRPTYLPTVGVSIVIDGPRENLSHGSSAGRGRFHDLSHGQHSLEKDVEIV